MSALPPDENERETAALLGGMKVQPSAEARARAFARLQAEFAAAPVVGRSAWHLRAAAAALFAVMLGGWAYFAGRPAMVVASVAALEGGVTAHGAHWFSRDSRPLIASTLAAGDSIRVGEDGGTLLRFSKDLTVRLSAGTHVRLAAADELELSVGQAFIDATPGAQAPLRVVTPHGVVTHLGTQYLVHSGRDGVEVAVREGRAQLKTNKNTVVAEQGHWVSHRDGGAANEGLLAPDDPRFDWVGALPTPFVLEGASLGSFLSWFQRESGLTPAFATGLDADSLRAVQLTGSIEHLEPLEALSYVLATADLSWRRAGAKVIIDHRMAKSG